MRISTLAQAVSAISFASAATVTVTNLHYVTVYGDDASSVVGLVDVAGATESTAETVSRDPTTAPTPTTTSEAYTTTPTSTPENTEPANTTPTTFVTKSSSSDSSSETGGIYAEIYESSGIDTNFAVSILDAHNTKRALHSAGELSWDKTLYEYAQNYADKYDCSGTLTHSGGQYGENLAVGYSSGPSALDAWYNEGNNYDYSAASVYDHFTQVVWKSTTKLGCAYTNCKAENWGLYVICSYDPAGNVVGEIAQNVLSN